MRAFVFGVEADRAFLEGVAARLREGPHAAADAHDCVIAIPGADAERDPWVEAETLTQSDRPGEANFAILGGHISHARPRLRSFERVDLEALAGFVARARAH